MPAKFVVHVERSEKLGCKACRGAAVTAERTATSSNRRVGASMLLWQLGMFLIALVDQRTMFRDFWQDWLIASGVIAFCLIGGRLIAAPLVAQVDTVLVVQIMVAILAFPLAARLVAWIDRKRGPA